MARHALRATVARQDNLSVQRYGWKCGGSCVCRGVRCAFVGLGRFGLRFLVSRFLGGCVRKSPLAGDSSAVKPRGTPSFLSVCVCGYSLTDSRTDISALLHGSSWLVIKTNTRPPVSHPHLICAPCAYSGANRHPSGVLCVCCTPKAVFWACVRCVSATLVYCHTHQHLRHLDTRLSPIYMPYDICLLQTGYILSDYQ